MKKDLKQIIIWAIVVVILASLLSAFTFWKPYKIGDTARIDVKYQDGKRTMLPSSPHYYEYEKAVKRALNGAMASLFLKVDVDIEVDNEYIKLCREQAPLWVELYFDKGKYQRMFFVLTEGEDRQTVTVFATTEYDYDSAEILGYRDCNCKELFRVIADYAVENG